MSVREVLRALPHSACLVDRAGRVTDVNVAWRMFGDGVARLGESYLEVCRRAAASEGDDAEGAAEVGERLERLLETGEAFSCVYPCATPGQVRYFELTACWLPDAQRALLIHAELPDYKAVLEDKWQQRTRFRASFEGSLDAVYTLRAARDERGEVVDFVFEALNPKAESELSTTSEEMRGRLLCEVFPISRENGFLERCVRVLSSGEPDEHVVQLAGGSDLSRWYFYKVVPHPGGITVINRNITEQRRQEQALDRNRQQLMEADELLGTVLSVLAEGVVVVNFQGEITLVNDNAERLLGRSERNARETPLPSGEWDVVDVEGRPLAPEDYPAMWTLRTGQPLDKFRIGVLRPDGERIWIDTNTRVLPGVGGVVSFEDVSATLAARKERQRLQARLQHAQRLEALGTLASGIAHDFNNVLSVVTSNGEVLAEVIEDELSRELVGDMLQAAERGAALVRRVMAFSGQVARRRRPCSPADILAVAEQATRRTLPVNVSLSARAAERLPAVSADFDELVQVLINLISNASDALGATGGRVRLRADLSDRAPSGERGRDYVKFSVIDDGEGIAPEYRERIFEPFYTTKPMGRGTGLGLSVVHGVVQAHGGGIELHSTPGEGSTFEVFLPAISEAGEAHPTWREAGGRETSKVLPARVLMVDDDPAVLKAVSRQLRARGHQVEGFIDASASLWRFRERPGDFDLALLDVDMPGMHGPALAAALRAERPGFPILLLTGNPAAIERLTGAAVPWPVLTKPLDIDAFEQLLAGGWPAGRL